MMKLLSSPNRRLGLAALVALPLAVAGISRPGHTQQDSYEGGLWRNSDGSLWCGGTCNKDINQVCCTVTIHQT